MNNEVVKAVFTLHKAGVITSDAALSLLELESKDLTVKLPSSEAFAKARAKAKAYSPPKVKHMRKTVIDVMQERGGVMTVQEVIAGVIGKIGTGKSGLTKQAIQHRVSAHLTNLYDKGIISHPKYGSWKLESGFATRSVQEIERDKHAANTKVVSGTYSNA